MAGMAGTIPNLGFGNFPVMYGVCVMNKDTLVYSSQSTLRKYTDPTGKETMEPKGLFVVERNPAKDPKWVGPLSTAQIYFKEGKTMHVCKLISGVRLLDFRVFRHMIVDYIRARQINDSNQYIQDTKYFRRNLLALGLMAREEQIKELLKTQPTDLSHQNFNGLNRPSNGGVLDAVFGDRCSILPLDEEFVNLLRQFNICDGYIGPRVGLPGDGMMPVAGCGFFPEEICLFNPKAWLSEEKAYEFDKNKTKEFQINEIKIKYGNGSVEFIDACTLNGLRCCGHEFWDNDNINILLPIRYPDRKRLSDPLPPLYDPYDRNEVLALVPIHNPKPRQQPTAMDWMEIPGGASSQAWIMLNGKKYRLQRKGNGYLVHYKKAWIPLSKAKRIYR
jgi:hypothetical protein